MTTRNLPRPPKRYKHQNATMRRYARSPILFDTSDPGTAKTRPALEQHVKHGNDRLLVVCPKSLMEAVWADEIKRWTPELSVSLAMASDRHSAFSSNSDVVVINTDGVKWLSAQPKRIFRSFGSVVIDESDHFKHPSSGRSQALDRIRDNFERAACLTGTPHSNSIHEVWNQVNFLDRGERLGVLYEAFRAQTCEHVRVGERIEASVWMDRDGAVEAVFQEIKDICIRHEFDECLDIPAMHDTSVQHQFTPKQQGMYTELEHRARLMCESGEIVGVNAAALRTKLLQVCSGAAYMEDGSYELLDPSRYELVADLIMARKHCVVFFQWRHQRVELMKALEKRKTKVGFIDGSVSQKRRHTLVQNFQAGKLRALLLQPQSGSQGLTLTKGTSVIWASPTYDPKFFRQGLHRIRRAGQTQRTECVTIVAPGSCEANVYAKMRKKDARMMTLLDLIAEI